MPAVPILAALLARYLVFLFSGKARREVRPVGAVAGIGGRASVAEWSPGTIGEGG